LVTILQRYWLRQCAGVLPCVVFVDASILTGMSDSPAHHPQLQSFNYFAIVEDMRKRDYLGQLELMVLFSVMRVNNAYGVLISQEISKQSGRDVSIASVYAALERLEKKGLITSLLGEPTAERGGKARTYFKPTTAGLKEARDAHGTLMRLSSGLPGLKGQIA
jgi:PadR family transcriptional regulator, regulatory protein PadR